jgi:hypothetical protein
VFLSTWYCFVSSWVLSDRKTFREKRVPEPGLHNLCQSCSEAVIKLWAEHDNSLKSASDSADEAGCQREGKLWGVILPQKENPDPLLNRGLIG